MSDDSNTFTTESSPGEQPSEEMDGNKSRNETGSTAHRWVAGRTGGGGTYLTGVNESGDYDNGGNQ